MNGGVRCVAINSGIMHMFPWFKRTPVVSQQSVDNIDRTLSTDEKIERLADRLGANNRPANDLASRDLAGRFTQTRVIAVCAQKGGAGKTTIAAHLAVQAGMMGHGPAVLVDTDPQGSLTEWWRARDDDALSL